MQNALAHKATGNEHFSKGDYASAADAYTKALRALSAQYHTAAPPTSRKLHANLYANRAICALKEGRWQACVDDASQCLVVDGYHAKALYRRSCAYEALGEPAKAIRDLRLLVRIDPQNRAAISQLRVMRAQMLAKPAGLRAALELIENAASNPPSGISSSAGVVVTIAGWV